MGGGRVRRGALGSAWRAGRAARGHTRAGEGLLPSCIPGSPLVSGGSRCMVVGQVEWAGLPGSSVIVWFIDQASRKY